MVYTCVLTFYENRKEIVKTVVLDISVSIFLPHIFSFSDRKIYEKPLLETYMILLD